MTRRYTYDGPRRPWYESPDFVLVVALVGLLVAVLA